MLNPKFQIKKLSFDILCNFRKFRSLYLGVQFFLKPLKKSNHQNLMFNVKIFIISKYSGKNRKIFENYFKKCCFTFSKFVNKIMLVQCAKNWTCLKKTRLTAIAFELSNHGSFLLMTPSLLPGKLFLPDTTKKRILLWLDKIHSCVSYTITTLTNSLIHYCAGGFQIKSVGAVRRKIRNQFLA